MYKFFVEQDQITEQVDKIEILGEDVNHINNVLRLKVGDEIQICSLLNKQNYICSIYLLNKRYIECNIIEKMKSFAESNIHIHVFQALPKFDKMEMIIEKCTEIGVSQITPVAMKRCIVKLDKNTEQKKIDRWNKILVAAAKQSKRDIIPNMNPVICLKDICNFINDYDIVLVAYEKETKNTLKEELKKIKDNLEVKEKEKIKIAVLIGPEGGIDKEEIEHIDKMKKNNDKIKIITLGERILRTETVSLFISSIIMYELGGI